MTARIRYARGSVGPALAAGIFCGRFLSELWTCQQNPVTGLSPFNVSTVTIITTGISLWLLRNLPLRHTWSLLLLGVYLLFPEPDPRIAMTVLAVVLLVIGQQFIGSQLGQSQRKGLVIAILLPAFLFFVLYVATLAPGLLAADNGEFQLIAANLGVAHPPGFSLYTLLAHLMTQLPGPASPALKVNLLSAITGAMTLAVVASIVLQLTARPAAAFTTVIALGSSTTFWSQSTTSNIRSLTGLFTSLAIYLAIRYWSAGRRVGREEPALQAASEATSRRRPDYYLVLFFLSLSSGIVHHPSLIFIGSILVAFVVSADPTLLRTPGRWIKPFVAGLVSLLPLLYLPWQGYLAASGQAIRGASPALTTWSGFLNHVLALGFRGDLFHFLEPSILWERFRLVGNVMTFQFSPWVLLGMGLGFILMLSQQRRLGLLLGGTYAIHALVTATYRAPQTVEYLLPAYIPAAICLGYAVARAGETVRWPAAGQKAVGHSFAAIMIVAAIAQGADRYPSYRYLHQETTARDYAQTLLDLAPPAAVILADWHWATPLWYLQEVEGRRTDVDVHFVFPTGEPYADTWVRRIRENYDQGRPVLSTHYDEAAFGELPIPEPAGEAFLFSPAPRHDLPQAFTPFELVLGDAIQILGYQLSQTSGHVDQDTRLTLAWRPAAALDLPTSLFVHLVGEDGQIYAQQDLPARPRAAGITLTQFQLTPRLDASPAEYALMIGAYGQTPLVDERGEARTSITSLSLQPMLSPPVTSNRTHRPVPGTASGKRLIGYDWDNTLSEGIRLYLHWQDEDGFQTEVRDQMPPEAAAMPAVIGPWGIRRSDWSLPYDRSAHYVPFAQGIVWMGPLLSEGTDLRPGNTVWLRQTLRSNRPVTRDIATSVRLVGYEPDGYLWDWWDLDDTYGIPALGGIPTLKWIAGSAVSDVHPMQVDAAAYRGQTVGVIFSLYDAFTGRPLAVLDQRFTRETPWRVTQITPAN